MSHHIHKGLQWLTSRNVAQQCSTSRLLSVSPFLTINCSHRHQIALPCPRATITGRCFVRKLSSSSTTESTSSSSRKSSSLIQDNIIRSPVPDITIPTNVSFHQMMFEKCDEFKNNLAIEDFLTGKGYTYNQLKEKSIRVASGLYKMGYRKGDVVQIFSTNAADVNVLMFACSASGLWLSCANPSFTARELATQLSHCEAKVVFAGQDSTRTVQAALADPQFPNKVKGLFVFGEAEGFQPFQKLLEDDGKSFPDVDIDPQKDVYAIPYSSGTTGLPKGVMLTHYTCVANCLQLNAGVHLSRHDVCVGLMPLYHVAGMLFVQYHAFMAGVSISYLPKFEPETFLKCLQNKKITLAHLPTPLIVFLAKHPLVDHYDLTSMKKVICGAAPVGPELTSAFVQRFSHKVELNQVYGMTELSPVCNIDTTCAAGSVGHMVANTKGKVVDTQTNERLGPGEAGEICIKGPQVMKGYYKSQKATDETIEPNGWLHTGDIGYYNEDGLLFIQDRLKELIKYKGNQVPPAELEALLLSHPCVQDAAVIGVPDETAGELPKAFIVKKSGSNVTEHDIVKFVEEKVSPIKRLRGGVQFLNEIPKSQSGKILRRILKSNYT